MTHGDEKTSQRHRKGYGTFMPLQQQLGYTKAMSTVKEKFDSTLFETPEASTGLQQRHPVSRSMWRRKKGTSWKTTWWKRYIRTSISEYGFSKLAHGRVNPFIPKDKVTPFPSLPHAEYHLHHIQCKRLTLAFLPGPAVLLVHPQA